MLASLQARSRCTSRMTSWCADLKQIYFNCNMQVDGMTWLACVRLRCECVFRTTYRLWMCHKYGMRLHAGRTWCASVGSRSCSHWLMMPRHTPTSPSFRSYSLSTSMHVNAAWDWKFGVCSRQAVDKSDTTAYDMTHDSCSSVHAPAHLRSCQRCPPVLLA